MIKRKRNLIFYNASTYDFCSVIPDWRGAVGWMLTIFPGTISGSGSGSSPALGVLMGSSISCSWEERILRHFTSDPSRFVRTWRGPIRSVSIFSATLFTASSSADVLWTGGSVLVTISLLTSLPAFAVGFCGNSSFGSTSESFGSSCSCEFKIIFHQLQTFHLISPPRDTARMPSAECFSPIEIVRGWSCSCSRLTALAATTSCSCID